MCCTQDVAAPLKDGAALTPVYPLPTMGTPLPPPSLNPTDGQADITWGLQLDTPIAVTAPHCPQEQH